MIKVIVYTVCFLAIVGISIYGINKLYQWGWTGGYNTADTEWKTIANEALEIQINNKDELAIQIQAQAWAHKLATDELEEQYSEDLENVELGKEMAIAAVLDGVVKLYKPINKKPIGFRDECDGFDEEAGLTICADRSDEEERGELHPQTSAFLFGLTLDADRNTEQLGACQKYVDILQKQCGAQDANSTD